MFLRGMKRIFRYEISVELIQLFLVKEGRILLGKRQINFFFLLGILFMTFMAIGIASGSLKYLEKKMNDPFIQWITVDVPYEHEETIGDIIKQLNENKSLQDSLRYSSVSGYNLFTMFFWDKEYTGTFHFKGRTVENDDPLMAEIFSKPGNKLYGRSFENEMETGIIATTKFLKKLGYQPNDAPNFISLSFQDPLDEKKERAIPVPIIAIVNDLPGLTDLFITPYFYNQYFGYGTQIGSNPFNVDHIQNIEFISWENAGKAKKLKQAIQNCIKSTSSLAKHKPDVSLSNNIQSYKESYQICVAVTDDTSLRTRDNIYKIISTDDDVKKFGFLRYYDYNTKLAPNTFSIQKFDKMTVKMESLSGLKSFQDYLLKQFRIRMDMAQVETRENYYFISRLTNIISLTLIIFSILSISLFIMNLLKNHLEKIKMNIGTFKAFGIDNASLEKIYLSIVYIFVIAAMFIALLLSSFIGQIGGVRLLLAVLNSSVEKGELYFDLFSYWTIISIVLVLITSFIALKKITGKIFNQTPGDLIYGR
jgi:hypothetical protein